MKRKIKQFGKSSTQTEEIEFEVLFPYEPTYDKIILVPFEEDDKIGGIIIPESAKRVLNQGEILKAGKDCKFAKVGMVVIFDLHTESRIQIDRTWFYILSEENIIAHSTRKNLGLDKDQQM